MAPPRDAWTIRVGNLRVDRDEFLAVWRAADRSHAHSEADAFVAAVARTCRWLAAVPPRTALCGGLPRSPVTQRACLAHPASIEAEWRAVRRDRVPSELATEDDALDGARATLRWAWRGDGPPPVPVPPEPGATIGE